MLVHGDAEGLLLYLQVSDSGRLAVPLVRDPVQVLAFSVADRNWLRRTEWLDLLVWVAAAQFSVGGHGQAPGSFGSVLPFLPGGHILGKDVSSLLVVVVAQGPKG